MWTTCFQYVETEIHNFYEVHIVDKESRIPRIFERSFSIVLKRILKVLHKFTRSTTDTTENNLFYYIFLLILQQRSYQHMKLTFQKDDLLNGINIVLKAVP